MDAPLQTWSVLIAEDHDLTRQGLIFGINKHAHFRVTAEALDGKEAIDLFMRRRPTMVIMDLGLPVLDGVEATRQIKIVDPLAKIIILTSHNNREEVFSAFSVGANAYCMKNIKMQRLLQVMESVLEGATWLDPQIADYVLQIIPNQATMPVAEGDMENPMLSTRELDVLKLLAQGKSNQEIAEKLVISPYTVKNHVCNIIQKLVVEDRTQAAIKAIRHKLV